MLEKVKINEIINLGILLWGFVDGIFKLGFESKWIFNFSGKYNHIREFPITIFIKISPIKVNIALNF
jgi:hypothetical protein